MTEVEPPNIFSLSDICLATTWKVVNKVENIKKQSQNNIAPRHTLQKSELLRIQLNVSDVTDASLLGVYIVGISIYVSFMYKEQDICKKMWKY